MSGTTKAILSMCVLLLAGLVVYYGMTPPVTEFGQTKQFQGTYKESTPITNPVLQFSELGVPPIAANLTTNSTLAESSPDSNAASKPIVEVDHTEDTASNPIDPDPKVIPVNDDQGQHFTNYTVKVDDTLGEIASKELGSFKMWRELASLNGIIDPSRIRPGMIIRLPQATQKSLSPQPSSMLESGTTVYIVIAGDTLSSIADEYYGDVNLFRRIAKANPTIDPNNIAIGMRLVIPQQ
jgi:nucleoid-associated protein YgaU